MGRLFQPGWARVTAIGLLCLAISVAAMRLPARHRGSPPLAAEPGDPLQADLVRCQGLGQAGASDARCLAVWSQSRRRFLGAGVRP
jgi:conjugative transfer region protein TrbK